MEVFDIVGNSISTLFNNRNALLFAIVGAVISAGGSFLVVAQMKTLAASFTNNPVSLSAFISELLVFVGSAGIIMLVLVLIGAFITASIMLSVSSKNADPVKIAKKAIARYPTYFLTILAAGIAVGIGCILLLIPGIFLAFKFCVAGVESVVGEKDVVESLKSSWKKTKGNFWGILAAFFVLYILIAVITGVIGIVTVLLKVSPLSTLFSAFFSLTSTILVVLIYQSLSRPTAPRKKGK